MSGHSCGLKMGVYTSDLFYSCVLFVMCISYICLDVCHRVKCVLMSNRCPYGDEQQFIMQLLVEYNESLKLPTTEFLLHTMFTKQKLSFLQV